MQVELMRIRRSLKSSTARIVCIELRNSNSQMKTLEQRWKLYVSGKFKQRPVVFFHSGERSKRRRKLFEDYKNGIRVSTEKCFISFTGNLARRCLEKTCHVIPCTLYCLFPNKVHKVTAKIDGNRDKLAVKSIGLVS